MRTLPFAFVAAATALVAGCGSYSSDYPIVISNGNLSAIRVFADGIDLGAVSAGATVSTTLRLRDQGYATVDITGNPSSPSPVSQVTFSARDLTSGTVACFHQSGGAQAQDCKPVTVTHQPTFIQFREADFCRHINVGGQCEDLLPVASFVSSPAAPAPRSVVVFNAAASHAAAGHAILQYLWNFGDPANPARGTGVTATHVYDTAGTYNVTLTVVDDAGHEATSTGTVTVR